MDFKSKFLKVYTLTIADIKGRYRNTFAGFIWVMFNPILMFLVHSLVFKHILKINVDRYFVFLLSGLLPWIFMTSAINQTAHLFITYRDVLMSFQINPLALLFSKLADNFINFIIPFCALFIFVLFKEDVSLEGIIFLPLNMFLMLAMTLALNVFISTLQVFFRDIQYIVQFAFSVLYFLTPIFYPEEMIPEAYRPIVDLNPFYAVIKPFQQSLWKYDPQLLGPTILSATLFTGAVSLLSYLLWRRKKNELYLYI